jgi:hypothetical protein
MPQSRREICEKNFPDINCVQRLDLSTLFALRRTFKLRLPLLK